MNPEELKAYIAEQTQKLQELQVEARDGGDIESTHIAADVILGDVLLELGYVELVTEYRKIPKWYA